MIRPLVVFGCVMNISDVITLAIIDKYGQFSDVIYGTDSQIVAFNFTICELNIDAISVAIYDDMLFIGYIQHDVRDHTSNRWILKNPILSAAILRQRWREQQKRSYQAAYKPYYQHIYQINLFDHNLLNKILDAIADILKKTGRGLN